MSLTLVGVAFIDAVQDFPRWVWGEMAYEAGEIPWPEYLVVAQYRNGVIFFVLLYLALYVLPFTLRSRSPPRS